MQYRVRIEFRFAMRASEDKIAIPRTLVFLVASHFRIEAFGAPHLVVDGLQFFLAVWTGKQFVKHRLAPCVCARLDENWKLGYWFKRFSQNTTAKHKILRLRRPRAEGQDQT